MHTRHRRHFSAVFAARLSTSLTVTLVAGCLFDTSVPDDVMVSCSADEDCPTDRVCAMPLGRCVAPNDLDGRPPEVVGDPDLSTRVATVGDEVRVSFVVSEDLLEDPLVELDRGAVSSALTLIEDATDRSTHRFTYAYVVDGSEAQGERDLMITLVDTSMNPGVRRLDRALLIDFTTPRIVGTVVLEPTSLTVDVLARVEFTLDEPLEQAPTVEMVKTTLDRPPVVWTRDASVEPPAYAFEHRATVDDVEGAYNVQFTAADAAGNTITASPLGTLVVDFSPPTLVSTEIEPARARPGDVVKVIVTLSEEPPTAPAVVGVLDTASGGPIELGFDPVLSAGNVITYRQILGDDEGVFDVVLRGATDAAGNTAADVALGTLEVDATSPLLTLFSHSGEGAPLSTADVLTVTLDVDEPLLSDPIVEVAGLVLARTSDAGAQPYVFELPLIDVALDGTFTIVVRLVDEVGNRSDLAPAIVSIDSVGPNIISGANAVLFSPAIARRGAVVLLTVVTNEPLASAPVLVWSEETGGPAFTYAPELSSGLSSNYTLTVDDSIPSGAYLLAGLALEDLAGNLASITFAEPSVLTVDLENCDEGLHDGGNGTTCVPIGSCLIGFHDGGAGVCVPTSVCSGGYHSGGAGTCVAVGTCSSGYWNGGDGACVPQGSCSSGFHNDGLGTCVVVGTCAPGYHDNGVGACAPNGVCANGFHDGGGGVCVVLGTCLSGFHNGGSGACVASGTCTAGYHDGGDGICLLLEYCSPGFHDGGSGTCVSIGACSAGFHNAGDGRCLPVGECAVGFHDGGDGSCLFGTLCSSGFQNGGDGVCVPLGTCSVGHHNGGPGLCVPLDTCSVGYHDGGNGACVSLGLCASGYHDGGDAVCVAAGSCSVGFVLRASGACEPPVAPVVPDVSATIPEDGVLAVPLNATDLDGDELTFFISVQPDHGTVTFQDGYAVYDADDGYVGPDAFSVVAYDGQFTSQPGQVSITIVGQFPRSCRQILAADPDAANGVYSIDPDGPFGAASVSVYCQMSTDGGGWTLVSSSTLTVDDARDGYHTNLQTLSPTTTMAGVWDGLRPLIAQNADTRFACKIAATEAFDVDLSFYNSNFYRTITTGSDVDSCFQTYGYQNGPWQRRNNLTGTTLPASDTYNQGNAGSLIGEDSCGDTNDFTVDFDNRGMDSNQQDGTDWGEDDGARKCRNVYNGVGWFIFTRELDAAPTVPAKPLSFTAIPEGDAVRVRWTAPADGMSIITRYRVYRSIDGAPDALLATIFPGMGETLVDDSAPQGSRLTYWVSALNDVGEGPRAGPASTMLGVPLGRTCRDLVEYAPLMQDGTYLIDPDDEGPLSPVAVYCSPAQAGGGWTLVASSQKPVDDKSADYALTLTTLEPEGSMQGVWSGLRGAIDGLADVRFACKRDATSSTFDVDMTFFDVDYYERFTRGSDADSCFHPYYDDAYQYNFGGDGPSRRRNNLTLVELPADDPFNGYGPGTEYFSGEMTCGDTNSFIVDFDDRGYAGGTDATDWGEQGNQPRCAGVGGAAFYVFVRPRCTENAPALPTVPRDFTVVPVAGSTALALGFSSPADEGCREIESYLVRRTGPDGTKSFSVPSDSKSFLDTDVTAGAHYTYDMAAVTSFGEGPHTEQRSAHVSTVRRDCRSFLEAGESANGTYLVDPTASGNVYPVYCDMETDGGGWALVASSTRPIADRADDYVSHLTGVAPSAPMGGVWDGFRSTIGPSADVRFACRKLSSNAGFDADLSFYGVDFYEEITSSYDDGQTCFNSTYDEYGAYSPNYTGPWDRRQNITGETRSVADEYAAGIMIGEDGCYDTSFVVDFDDGGLWGSFGDGTDWGQAWDNKFCGDGTGQSFFVFVRPICSASNPTLPSTPEGFGATTAEGDASITLSFSPSFDGCASPVTYHIYRTDQPGSPIASTTETTYTDTDVTIGVRYGYWVTASNSVGQSAPTAETSLIAGVVRSSCLAWLFDGYASDGPYAIDPDGAGAVVVYCDMSVDGGGWTLVSSSTRTVSDAADSYRATLATIHPDDRMSGVWDGMRAQFGGWSDIRFACRTSPYTDAYDVDLSFYWNNMYDVITSGSDDQTCFAPFYDNTAAGPWDRQNNLTYDWRSSYDGYYGWYGGMVGEDWCGDTSSFTVDFEDQGMQGYEDGTDWGSEYGTPKCGTYYSGAEWFVFVR